MKIAIMMRAIDQKGGFHLYVERLVEARLQTDRKNSYLLWYTTSKWLGRFRGRKNAQEILVGPSNKLLWDQAVYKIAISEEQWCSTECPLSWACLGRLQAPQRQRSARRTVSKANPTDV